MDDEQFLNERVDVLAVFSPGWQSCKPLKFRRASGREVIITKIGLGFPHERGSRTVHIFDVTDGQADYRLEFDAERLTWFLKRESEYSGQ